jgi:hypothetical protein
MNLLFVKEKCFELSQQAYETQATHLASISFSYQYSTMVVLIYM